MVELTKEEQVNIFRFAAAIAFADECYQYAASSYKKILVESLTGTRKERREQERDLDKKLKLYHSTLKSMGEAVEVNENFYDQALDALSSAIENIKIVD